VSVLATHAIFVGPALERLQGLPIQQLIGTNSVESDELPAHFQVVNLAPMIAETIGRLNRDQSLEPLLLHA
jgi:ribose-phosphate pyrophosphokinase